MGTVFEELSSWTALTWHRNEDNILNQMYENQTKHNAKMHANIEVTIKLNFMSFVL